MGSKVSAAEFEAGERCSICLTGGKKPAVMVEVCRHKFHRDCLNAWVARNPICPNDRRPIQIESLFSRSLNEMGIIFILSYGVAALSEGKQFPSKGRMLQVVGIVSILRGIGLVKPIEENSEFQGIATAVASAAFTLFSTRN
jgi:hypothetical protein